jgi:glycosyltransferase involved in cell wall biosynthesis
MRVCFLSSLHASLDKRVFEKEAKTLANAGYQVTHLAPDDADSRVIDGIQIETFRKPKGLLARLYQLPALYRKARKIDADIYHCNEFDSFLVGIALRLIAGKKCVFDVHEFIAHDLAENHSAPWLRPFVRCSMSVVVRLLAYQAHAVVLANASLMPGYAHLPKSRVFIVENFSTLTSLSPSNRSEQRRAPFRVVHIGLLGRARGAFQMLEALKLARRKDVELFCIGRINDGSEQEFRSAVTHLEIEGRVHIYPWLPFKEMLDLTKTADIGLILFQPGHHAHTYALPHKLFDYMAAELAVIAPDFSLRIGEIIHKSQCGILVDASSPQAIANAIDHLCDDPNQLQCMGFNGRMAVLRRYNWEYEAKTLLSLYESLYEGKTIQSTESGGPQCR